MKTVQMLLKKRKLALLLLLLALLAGCAGEPPEVTPSSTAGGDTPLQEQADSSAEMEPVEPVPAEEGMTIYDCDGIQIALPNTDVEQLLIEVCSWSTENSTKLLSIREKASVEAWEAEYSGEIEMGQLFDICRMNLAGLEEYLDYGLGEGGVFAKDENGYYYVCFKPTDIPFYRQGGEIDIDSEDWKNWGRLWESSDEIEADMILRNGLTPYSKKEHFSKTSE